MLPSPLNTSVSQKTIAPGGSGFFIVKMLDTQLIADKTWDPLIYLINEIRLHQRYFKVQKTATTNILEIKDYFVDFDSSRFDFKPKFYVIYENHQADLRSILENRRMNRQSYSDLSIVKFLADLVSGVTTLHRMGKFVADCRNRTQKPVRKQYCLLR